MRLDLILTMFNIEFTERTEQIRSINIFDLSNFFALRCEAENIKISISKIHYMNMSIFPVGNKQYRKKV